MLRLLAAILLALIAAGLIPAARADSTGTWEQDLREGFGRRLSEATRDLFSGPPRALWRRGLVLETPQKAFTMHVGYEGQLDLTAYSDMAGRVEAAAGEGWTSGGYMRRSRLYVEGFLLKHWYVRARYGVDGFTGLDFADLFVEWGGLRDRVKHAPAIRFGQVKEPMTMDWMTSSKWNTFVERAMVTTAIAPNRTPGVRIHGDALGRRLTYQAGAFLAGESRLTTNRQSDDAGAVTGRVTGLPWVSSRSERHLLHVGLAGSYRWHLDRVRYRSKLESWRGPNALDTTNIDASRVVTGAAEIYYQRERFSIQGELAVNTTHVDGARDATLWGGYIQTSYFLRGRGKHYNRSFGVLGRIKPRCRLFCPAKRGWGDLELAARYSTLDLDDGPVDGGRAWNLTLGLNWWARDNIRVSLNYIHSSVSNAYGDPQADSTLNTLTMRMQFDL